MVISLTISTCNATLLCDKLHRMLPVLIHLKVSSMQVQLEAKHNIIAVKIAMVCSIKIYEKDVHVLFIPSQVWDKESGFI